VILDEPTSGLDPIGCREVKDLIVELARRGKTVILSSHLLADVEDVCDRVVIYYGGKIQAMGTLKELLSTPDRLRITMPVLERETLEKVLSTIRADLGRKFPETAAQESVLVDSPSQNLESYFLDVVKKARSSAEETSGAVSGGTVARYLRSEESERVQAKDRILERLASSKESPAEAPAPEKKKEEAPAAPAVDASKKLSALLSKTTVQAPAEPSAVKEATPASPQSEQRQENLKKASEKLSGLLGNKGNK
jgi:ABC-2 type transport system ATP-binding protein